MTRSFLDYRVPVYDRLNRLTGGNLTLVYYRDVVPPRVRRKAEQTLGPASLGLDGELRMVGPRRLGGTMANTKIRIPVQPGLIRAVRRSEPEVVVSDGFFQWTYAALWLRALRGIPHVMCYERAAHNERNAQWYRVAYRKFVMRWIDVACCSGRLCGEYVQSLGFPRERITYGHMVADVGGMQKAVAKVSEAQVQDLAAKLTLKGLVFLYVGRLIPLKGLCELLKAWKTAIRHWGDEPATLLVVGDGPQRAQLERHCVDNDLSGVRFAGAMDYDELAVYYRAAQAFIIPTLEDNWSLVVPEAMAAGLPILCSRYNGCWPEYVTPANGWVFDPLDVGDTAGCLTKCRQARDRLAAMGAESRRIVAGHTADHAARAVFDSCKAALSCTSKRHPPQPSSYKRVSAHKPPP